MLTRPLCITFIKEALFIYSIFFVTVLLQDGNNNNNNTPTSASSTGTSTAAGASAPAAPRREPMVAMICPNKNGDSRLYHNQYTNSDGKWATDFDRKATCKQDKGEILDYCKKVSKPGSPQKKLRRCIYCLCI